MVLWQQVPYLKNIKLTVYNLLIREQRDVKTVEVKSKMEAIEVLRRSDVFHYLEENELKIVEKMCTPQVFEAGTIICKQDQEEKYICD